MSSKKKIKKSHTTNSSLRRKSLPLVEPNVSRILKVSETNQLEELDDSFEHPLHSTAVDAYGEEHSQNQSLGRVSAPQTQNTDRRYVNLGFILEVNLLFIPQKAPNTTQFWAKKKQPSEENASDPSVDSPHFVQVWCPKELKRSPRDITELDVVLAEVEKITANYRQSIDSNICRKAINDFSSAFKDQITDLVTGVEELKNMKKKNAKVNTYIVIVIHAINMQMQASKSLSFFRAEPQLTQLQREYAEVQERKSSLRQTVELITDLKELQEDCLDNREENPKEKLVYGTSSLPALLVESRRILGAERHFENINRKLEETLSTQKERRSNKN
uniref:Centromere protein U n=1 Tax=Malurus cyaneus samueli TaxID=2593467 RepID=A0A8C5T9G2_9PASS